MEKDRVEMQPKKAETPAQNSRDAASNSDQDTLNKLQATLANTADVVQEHREAFFTDPDDKMNLSVRDIGGSAIVVSQFTLYADCRKGNRPSFIGAAAPDIASPLVDRFARLLTDQGVPTQTGVFGAHMDVELLNSGPVTIILDY